MEILFEFGRFGFMIGIALFIGWIGWSRQLLGQWAWRFSFVAFLLLIFGAVIDVIDDYEFTRALIGWHDTPLYTFLEKGVGYLGGFGLIFLAMWHWLPYGDALTREKLVAQKASRTKTEFLANMSHELRTPLNAILGFSEMMGNATLGPLGNAKYEEYVKDINDSGRHLLALIDDILDLSKIEADKLELDEEEVDVADVIRSCIVLIRERAENGGVKLQTDIPDGLPALHADKRKLKQILVNLLSNAVKFTPDGGEVTLKTWSRPDSGYVFQVIDTGIGIALKDIPTALSPFGQVDSALSRKFAGTGLGLPLTKSLVEMHGGSLDLQSEEGAGTTVTVRFPSERIVQAPIGQAARAPAAQISGIM